MFATKEGFCEAYLAKFAETHGKSFDESTPGKSIRL